MILLFTLIAPIGYNSFQIRNKISQFKSTFLVLDLRLREDMTAVFFISKGVHKVIHAEIVLS